jgi:homoserine O-acetyltransferase
VSTSGVVALVWPRAETDRWRKGTAGFCRRAIRATLAVGAGSISLMMETGMTMFGWFARTAASTIVSLIAVAASAADYPLPKEGDWVARDFRFHTGEIVPQLRLHYTTVGEPSGEPVLVLHGTAGSGAGMLTSAFAGELFGPGQPLDARKYFIILPDAIGAGQSSKPSDGLRTKFPRYNNEDMIAAQYLLVTQGLQIRHLRLVIGNSLDGRHAHLALGSDLP